MRAESHMAKAAAGKNLVQLLLERAANPENVAARHKKNGAWQDASWAQIVDDVKSLSAALVAEGVKQGDRVAIFAGTSLQWVITDLAISAAGANTNRRNVIRGCGNVSIGVSITSSLYSSKSISSGRADQRPRFAARPCRDSISCNSASSRSGGVFVSIVAAAFKNSPCPAGPPTGLLR